MSDRIEKFTPGPWGGRRYISSLTKMEKRGWRDDIPAPVCTITHVLGRDEENAANGVLIEKAPEMYDLLSRLVCIAAYGGGKTAWEELAADAAQILREARGEA